MLDYEKKYEKEQFKQMSFKKKLEHIFTYYKVEIVVGLVILFVGIWALNHFVWNPEPKIGFEICCYNFYNDEDKAAELEDKLTDAFFADSDGKTKATVMYLTDFGDDATYAEQANTVTYKIIGEIAAGDLDVFVANEVNMTAFAQSSYMLPLTEVFSEEELAQMEVKIKEKTGIEEVFLITYIDAEKQDALYPVAINTAAFAVLNDIMPDYADHYISVIVNSKRYELVRAFIFGLMDGTF